jgi:uncharacterized protein
MLAVHTQKAVALGRRLVNVWLATAAEGLPHVAAAHVRGGQDNRMVLAAWFCPRTLANLSKNRQVSVVVWDPASEQGFQLDGVVEAITEVAMLDGFVPGLEGPTPIPQAERELEIRVTAVLAFARASHSDVPLT